MEPQFQQTQTIPQNQGTNEINQSNPNQPSENQILDRQIDQGDIQFAAEFYKRLVSQREFSQPANYEELGNCMQIGNQSWQREDQSSEPLETPHFGLILQAQQLNNAQSSIEGVASYSEQEGSKHRSHLNQPSNILKKNFVQMGIQNQSDTHKEHRDEMVDEVRICHTTSQNTERQEMRFRPALYGIDHSKQYFEAHPFLSLKLKKYKEFVRCYASGAITPHNYLQGCSLSNDLALNGPQLLQLGRTVFINVFRRMEQYLLNNCRKKIVKLADNDVLSLSQLMFEPEILGPNKTAALEKFAKLAYDIPAQVSQAQIAALYSFMMKWINQKHATPYFNFDYGDQAGAKYLWTRERQIEFCRLYQTKKSLVVIADVFNQQENQQKVTFFELRAKFQQLIRNAITKISNHISLYDKHNQCWLTLTERDLRKIARSPKGLSLRQILLSLNIKKYIFLQEIRAVSTAIAALFRENSKQRPAIKIKDDQRVVSDKKAVLVASDSEQQAQKGQKEDSEWQSESEQYMVPANSKKKSSYFAYRTQPKQQTLLDLYDAKSNSSKTPKKFAAATQVPKKKTGAYRDNLAKLRPSLSFGKSK